MSNTRTIEERAPSMALTYSLTILFAAAIAVSAVMTDGTASSDAKEQPAARAADVTLSL